MDKIKNIKKDIDILFLLKTAVGSAIAIIIADRLGLAYSASAGIITLLTIQNTKKETITVAIKRIIAFIMAVLIAYICFSVIGYTSLAFGAFVFLFVAFCNIFSLQDGISMNAVLTTHFLIEKNMDISFILNEVSILLIGMSIGILLNLIMPKKEKKILVCQRKLEDEIILLLKDIAKAMRGSKEVISFKEIDNLMDYLLKIAYEDAENRLLSDTGYLISYLEMRKNQISVLKKIEDDIGKLSAVVLQSNLVADYIEVVSLSFHELNDVSDLLNKLDDVYDYFRKDKLPVEREEFENRAILFSILKEIEYFLILKRNFYLETKDKNYQFRMSTTIDKL